MKGCSYLELSHRVSHLFVVHQVTVADRLDQTGQPFLVDYSLPAEIALHNLEGPSTNVYVAQRANRLLLEPGLFGL